MSRIEIQQRNSQKNINQKTKKGTNIAKKMHRETYTKRYKPMKINRQNI